jgi:hypothetical protein
MVRLAFARPAPSQATRQKRSIAPRPSDRLRAFRHKLGVVRVEGGHGRRIPGVERRLKVRGELLPRLLRKNSQRHRARSLEGADKGKPGRMRPGDDFPAGYSATASFAITTFKCALTSLCSFTETVNSPRVFSGSWSWICFRSRLIPFFTTASAISPEVTDPNN